MGWGGRGRGREETRAEAGWQFAKPPADRYSKVLPFPGHSELLRNANLGGECLAGCVQRGRNARLLCRCCAVPGTCPHPKSRLCELRVCFCREKRGARARWCWAHASSSGLELGAETPPQRAGGARAGGAGACAARRALPAPRCWRSASPVPQDGGEGGRAAVRHPQWLSSPRAPPDLPRQICRAIKAHFPQERGLLDGGCAAWAAKGAGLGSVVTPVQDQG